jgi:hypothetical protein
MANLKKAEGYYNYDKRTLADFFSDVAARGWRQAWRESAMRGRMRMSPRDILDVSGHAYTYLINGLPSGLEAEYDWLLTQRLILQPRFETAFAFSQVRDFGVGKGLTYVQMGLRLRYQIRREFAPYVGFAWQRKLGDSADLAREEGEDIDNPSLVAGVRMWF